MIKNIIFDVGDVLLEYRWKDMLMDYGLSEAEAIRVGTLMFDDPLWRQLDYGKSEKEVILEYQQKYPKDKEVTKWFITNGEYMHVKREDVWEKVHKLKQIGYHLYILSNYSKDLFDKHTKGASFLEDMDGTVVSYQVGAIKPEKAIYEYLFETYQLSPQDCFFLDDRLENIEAAKELGMDGVQIKSREQLLALLDTLIVKKQQQGK